MILTNHSSFFEEIGLTSFTTLHKKIPWNFFYLLFYFSNIGFVINGFKLSLLVNVEMMLLALAIMLCD